ncbi:MAG: glycosyltransferase family 2 protein [Asticcacaulis sp.]
MTQPQFFHNDSFAAVTPRLSVLIPFYKESALPLLHSLHSRDPAAVEVILIDDGSAMPDLTAQIRNFVAQSPLACQLMTLPVNEGRAKGRNRLTEAARGSYFLFLDADMLPDEDGFLDRWLAQTQKDTPVVFGGFSLLQAPDSAHVALHKRMAGQSDCLTASERRLHPEKYVFTSNLLVRRDVFASEGFDPAFTGWGWEDVEWAMRVQSRFGIGHIDNTATHMGLDTPQTLARKYEQSVGNFARVIAKHPDIVAQYPSYKAARLLKRLPLMGLWRTLIRAVALSAYMPLSVRAFALRLYRAALYSQVV